MATGKKQVQESQIGLVTEQTNNDKNPKNKRLVSWWDNAEEYNELSSMFLGVPKPNDPWFSSGKRPLNSLLSTKEIIIIEDDDDEEALESERKKPRLGLGSFCDDSSVVKGSSSRVDPCFSSTDPHEKKTRNDERLVSSNHDFVDRCEDECVAEGYRHVTLEDLGVTVQDLKSIPWEAFDSTWEITSKTMDPWLGGYVQDMNSLLSSSLT